MPLSKYHFVIMSKFPRLGEVKTRLIPELGAEAATELHEQMSQHIVSRVRSFANSWADVSFAVHIANATTEETRAWLGVSRVSQQVAGDLGVKMQHAANSSFTAGAQRVIIVGTDCPFLTESIFKKVLLELESHDAVYVPAHDGGFVLLGLSSPQTIVFEKIRWGSATVMDESIQQMKSLGLSYKLLPALADVDLPADVPAARQELGLHT